ncbi:MAG TPA: NfeD family protein [Pseudomonadales bacterium]|nr:NfeD family protein [Pseudomonadales bacterium]
MSWLAENLSNVLIAAGIGALIVDMVFFGFGTFILIFLGGSLLISGLAMLLGILPNTMDAALWSNAILTAILGVVLWKPLRRIQNKNGSKQITNDFASDPFVLQQDVDIQGLTEHMYSGVRWKLRSHQPLSKGTLVEVVKVEVGSLWVKAKEQ